MTPLAPVSPEIQVGNDLFPKPTGGRGGVNSLEQGQGGPGGRGVI